MRRQRVMQIEREAAAAVATANTAKKTTIIHKHAHIVERKTTQRPIVGKKKEEGGRGCQEGSW